jgi:hypothetical protein
MKLLLDENLPKRLKQDFPGHKVFTVRDKKWNGIKNGELLKLIIENALLTFDQNLLYQQNFNKYYTTVFVLTATINTDKKLTKLSGKIQNYLSKKESLLFGSVIIQPI